MHRGRVPVALVRVTMTGMHALTLVSVVIIVSFGWAMALAYVAMPRKKDLLWCALAMALHGVAYVCFAFTGRAPYFVPVVLGNAALLACLVLLVKVFLDLRAVQIWRWWWAPLVALPVVYAFFLSPADVDFRVILGCLVYGGLCVALVWLLWRPHPALSGRGRRITLTGVALVLSIFVLRLFVALTDHHPTLSFSASNVVQSLTLLAALLGMSLLVLGVVLMSEERLAKALSLSRNNYRLLVENASEGIVVVQSGRMRFANPMLLSLLGYTEEDVLGQNLLQFVHEDDRAKVMEAYQLRLQGRAQGLKYPLRVLTCDRGTRWFEISGTHFDWEGRPATLNFLTDIQDRVEMESQIRSLAYHDSLTQLPNRVLMLDRLKQALASHKRLPRYGALMFLDLDNFKPVNDAHGHIAGDQVLIEVAQRLLRCVRETDTVARFGGDEFVVMLADLHEDRPTSLAQAQSVADKILHTVSEPYHLSLAQGDGSVRAVTHKCGVSIGLVLFHSETGCEDQLLRQADSAMYRAKDAGRHTIVLGEPQPGEAA